MSAKISNKSYVNLDKVSLKKMKLPPVYIPYIHFFFVCVIKFAEMGKICVSHFLSFEKLLIENYAGYNLLYSIICDIKEIAKEAKIR